MAGNAMGLVTYSRFIDNGTGNPLKLGSGVVHSVVFPQAGAYTLDIRDGAATIASISTTIGSLPSNTLILDIEYNNNLIISSSGTGAIITYI